MQKCFIKPTLERLVTHRKIHPCLFIYDGFVMRERIEPIRAVVSAHAAFTYTAEAHLACGKVNDNIIDTAAAIGKL